MSLLLWILALLGLYGTASCEDAPCRPNRLNYCVCTSVYCDTISGATALGEDEILHWKTTRDKPGFHKTSLKKFDVNRRFDLASNLTYKLKISSDRTYQAILGFGGAFTDSTAINIASLSTETQRKLIESYFSASGIEYTMGRVPIASCDFSTHVYSYDDSVGDLDMKNFSLAQEDYKLKIPLIQKAHDTSQRGLKLFASAWSAPGWMKTNNDMVGGGYLKEASQGDYYKAWAKYHLRFLDEYRKSNVSFWGLTAGNEPTEGQEKHYTFQALGFTAETQRDFIKNHLGPTLASNGYSELKVMILDDQRLMLPTWAHTVLSDAVAQQYVSGIAVHWYMDFLVPPTVLSQTHELYPEHFLLATEACNSVEQVRTLEGSWLKAEAYAQDVINDLNHWVEGWVDWNMALDWQGGPSWVGNYVDSPVIVSAEEDVFYKTPSFYVLGHFSKFLVPGSVRLELLSDIPDNNDILATAFVRPDSVNVLIVSNTADRNINLQVFTNGQMLTDFAVDGHSMNTYMWT